MAAHWRSGSFLMQGKWHVASHVLVPATSPLSHSSGGSTIPSPQSSERSTHRPS
jgi:hypothetical protein